MNISMLVNHRNFLLKLNRLLYLFLNCQKYFLPFPPPLFEPKTLTEHELLWHNRKVKCGSLTIIK